MGLQITITPLHILLPVLFVIFFLFIRCLIIVSLSLRSFIANKKDLITSDIMSLNLAHQGEEKNSIARLSVLSNTGLIILKIVVGLALGLVSIVSEAIHSGMDLIAAIIAFFCKKVFSSC